MFKSHQMRNYVNCFYCYKNKKVLENKVIVLLIYLKKKSIQDQNSFNQKETNFDIMLLFFIFICMNAQAFLQGK